VNQKIHNAAGMQFVNYALAYFEVYRIATVSNRLCDFFLRRRKEKKKKIENCVRQRENRCLKINKGLAVYS
jgi:hypothetical protein